MSRTRRRDIVYLNVNHKPLDSKMMDIFYRGCGEMDPCDYYSKRNRKYDHKRYYKSPSSFKKMRKKIRKAKERHAMANKNYDNIPRFRTENDWLWF
jgi:hypothetical protein